MSKAFHHGAFMTELRKRRGTVPTDWYRDIMASLEVALGQPAPAPADAVPVPAAKGPEPVWLTEAQRHLGVKEIPGPKHNPTILGWVRSLGGYFTDDETPWCGTFMAHVMQTISEKPPQHWYRAKAWADWGKPTPLRRGAVAVFGRQGGGHVGLVVGESPKHLYVLGGNQNNSVNIAPIARDRLLALRWPAGRSLSDVHPTPMTGGAVSRNEA